MASPPSPYMILALLHHSRMQNKCQIRVMVAFCIADLVIVYKCQHAVRVSHYPFHAYRRCVTVRSDRATAMQPSSPAQMPVTGVPKDGCTASMATGPGAMPAAESHSFGDVLRTHVLQYATSCKRGSKYVRELLGIRLERVDVRMTAGVRQSPSWARQLRHQRGWDVSTAPASRHLIAEDQPRCTNATSACESWRSEAVRAQEQQLTRP